MDRLSWVLEDIVVIMDEFKILPKRSATFNEGSQGSPGNLKVPEVLSRYSTRLHLHSESPEIMTATPVYKPAPKPSQLLLEYLYPSPSKSQKTISKASKSPIFSPSNSRIKNLSPKSNFKSSSYQAHMPNPSQPSLHPSQHLQLPSAKPPSPSPPSPSHKPSPSSPHT